MKTLDEILYWHSPEIILIIFLILGFITHSFFRGSWLIYFIVFVLGIFTGCILNQRRKKRLFWSLIILTGFFLGYLVGAGQKSFFVVIFFLIGMAVFYLGRKYLPKNISKLFFQKQ